MSKPRGQITLQEMQDECKKHGGMCAHCEQGIKQMCDEVIKSPAYRSAPIDWNLADPPRFSDEAMAFFKWWYDRGAKKAINVNSYELGAITVFEDKNERQIGNAQEYSIIAEVKKNGNQIDLAELLEKDGAK